METALKVGWRIEEKRARRVVPRPMAYDFSGIKEKDLPAFFAKVRAARLADLGKPPKQRRTMEQVLAGLGVKRKH